MTFSYSENYLENGEVLANKERKRLLFGKLFLQYIIVRTLTHILGMSLCTIIHVIITDSLYLL